jgi:hypothetical protein
MSSHRSTKYGKESRSQIDKYREYQVANPVSINVADYHEQEEEEQQTIEFFCNSCSRKLHTVEGDDRAHCYNCSTTWSLSKDNLPTIGKRVTEQESLDDDNSQSQEVLISQTDPLDQLLGKDTESAEDNNTRPKLTGALASLRDNSGTLKILDYVEKSGDGKVIRSYHESSSSKKGRAR